jgi:transaldolase/glucose-6-phosphate isomerase
MTMVNPLKKIQEFGQSIWLDYIRRGMLESGKLKELIAEDGLRGVTVNPSILDKAIAGSHDYDEAIKTLVLEGYKAARIYEILAVEDVRQAADLFHDLYSQSDGKHGFVSLEVSPYLAHDTEATIEEARRFWHELDRPNVMIKVPATLEGLPAIEKLIEEGINVNVTLLFGLPRYREVVKAYLQGLSARMQAGKPLYHVNSVASFFLSRIDVLVDPMLEQKIHHSGNGAQAAAKLHGQVAIASAKAAYQIYKELFAQDQYAELKEEGARSQRLLWASTSTKNPAYSDVKYVEALIGMDTVNTLPLETLNNYRDHGEPQARLESNLETAQDTLAALSQVGIDIDQVTQQLEDEGVEKFTKSYDHLLETIEAKRATILDAPVDRQTFSLMNYRPAFNQRLNDLEAENFVHRLWIKDASLWKDDAEARQLIRNALGWLHVAEKMEDNLQSLSTFKDEVQASGFTHVVHIGMGGSSLAPKVMADILKPTHAGLAFEVLDTTSPETILQMEQNLPLATTLFIIASKSGSTAETRALADYFYARVAGLKGEKAGENFIAITDPGSPLVEFAADKQFRRTFLNFADIGGRYSALSYFGLVPAVLMGVEISALLERALRMEHACAFCIPASKNPGVQLGAVLGELARKGRDKVTIVASDSLASFGMWLEQLIAESTGKEGRGLLPVVAEQISAPEMYGDDRIFVTLQWRDHQDFPEKELQALRSHGFPVISILLDDALDLGQEFFRWEIAVATAGSILSINAFDQPNVQESKDNTNRILARIRQGQALPDEKPALVDGSIKVHAEQAAAHLDEIIAKFLAQGEDGDFIAVMAYLPETPETQHALQELHDRLLELTHLATTIGFGPRFLHSTGQYHKGGANKGLFLQLTADQRQDVPVPGQPYTFNTFLKAQALGDLQALRKHNRRVMHIELGEDIASDLHILVQALYSKVLAMPS